MKIKELIKILEKYPQDLEIMVNGYESGFDEISKNRIQKLKLKKVNNPNDYDGEFEEVDFVKNNNKEFEALILGRKS